jgi:hypothetical protein
VFLLFLCVLGWVGGIDVRPLVREDVWHWRRFSPLFYSHRRRHMYRLVVAVLYNNNNKIPICCRGSSAHLKGSLRIGGRSRVEEWEENQIGLHVKDLVTLFIRRWRILLDFWKKKNWKKNHFPNYFWRHFWKNTKIHSNRKEWRIITLADILFIRWIMTS